MLGEPALTCVARCCAAAGLLGLWVANWTDFPVRAEYLGMLQGLWGTEGTDRWCLLARAWLKGTDDVATGRKRTVGQLPDGASNGRGEPRRVPSSAMEGWRGRQVVATV